MLDNPVDTRKQSTLEEVEEAEEHEPEPPKRTMTV
jgi:hypothetical protein